VRELRLVIERAGELVENGTLSGTALAEAIALGNAHSMAPVGSLVQSSRSTWTRGEVLTVLQSNAWDVQRAAASLHVGRTTLFKQLKALGISLRTERKFTRSPAFTERS
jgi:transcriptional regulator of acetoin/glycerol metabolism